MGLSAQIIFVIVIVAVFGIALFVIVCRFINNCIQSRFDSFEEDASKEGENTLVLLDTDPDSIVVIPNGIANGGPLSLSYSRHSIHSQHSGHVIDPHPEYLKQISSEPVNPYYSQPNARQKLQKQLAFDRGFDHVHHHAMEDTSLDRSRSRVSFSPSESSHFSQYSWLQRLISENAANRNRRPSDSDSAPRTPLVYNRHSSIGSPIVEDRENGGGATIFYLPRQQSAISESGSRHANDEPHVPPPTYMEAVKRTRSASI